MKTIVAALVLLAISTPAMAQGGACSRLYREYEASSYGPKAWAVGRDGGCGFASARTSSSLPEARQRAFNSCSEYARGCRVMEEEHR